MIALNHLRWFAQWFGLATALRATPEQVQQVRQAVRSADLELAQRLLADCGPSGACDADCLNLQGVIAERRGDWPRARSSWVRAARADSHCRAAKRNLARYYELFTWGRCRHSAALGDEPEF